MERRDWRWIRGELKWHTEVNRRPRVRRMVLCVNKWKPTARQFLSSSSLSSSLTLSLAHGMIIPLPLFAHGLWLEFSEVLLMITYVRSFNKLKCVASFHTHAHTHWQTREERTRICKNARPYHTRNWLGRSRQLSWLLLFIYFVHTLLHSIQCAWIFFFILLHSFIRLSSIFTLTVLRTKMWLLHWTKYCRARKKEKERDYISRMLCTSIKCVVMIRLTYRPHRPTLPMIFIVVE